MQELPTNTCDSDTGMSWGAGYELLGYLKNFCSQPNRTKLPQHGKPTIRGDHFQLLPFSTIQNNLAVQIDKIFTAGKLYDQLSVIPAWKRAASSPGPHNACTQSVLMEYLSFLY